MRFWWLVLLFSFSPWDSLQRIALRNQYARQAQEAYAQKNYLEAAVLYEKVREQDQGSPAPTIQLNLAHSYFHLQDYSRASPLYRALLKRAIDKAMVSGVATQLAVIEAAEGNYKKALALSKQALTADEENQAARYNYELIQKFILLHPEKLNSPPPPRQANQGPGASSKNGPGQADGKPSQSSGRPSRNAPGASETQEQRQAQGQNPGNQPSPSAAGNQKNPDDTQGKAGDQAGSEEDKLLQTRFERLKKMQLTPGKARQLLDAMRQEEAQYLQHKPRRKNKKQDDRKPDW